MSISPRILEQASESLRKIRNSARFILGNTGDAGTRAEFECVPKDSLGLVSRGESTALQRAYLTQVDRYVMHELYELEQAALSSYAQYNFPKGTPAVVVQGTVITRTMHSHFYPH